MSLDTALLTARSGLLHTQRALASAANNVANADTPGYTRKTVAGLAEQGMGVRSLAPGRDVDEALLTELDSRRAAAAAAGLRADLLAGIEAVHGSPEAGDGLGDLVAALRTGFEDLRADPAQAGRQSALVLAAEELATRFNEVSGAIGQARQQAHDTVVTEVAAINAGLRDIATLTRQIREQIALTGDAAALQDQRDAAISTLSASIEVRALKREDGGIVLVARNGIVLPLDADRDAFSTADATLGAAAFHGAGGTIPGVTLGGLDVTANLLGGRLAEAIALRDQTLPRYQAEADLAAANLAARFDAQGLALFTDAAGAVPDTSLPYAGSMVLGFAIVWFTVSLTQRPGMHVPPPVMLWVLGLVLMDVFTVTIRRLARRRSPMAPDRDHIHHVLLRRHGPLRTLAILVSANLALAGVGAALWSAGVPDYWILWTYLGVCAAYFVLFFLPFRLYRLRARQVTQEYERDE